MCLFPMELLVQKSGIQKASLEGDQKTLWSEPQITNKNSLTSVIRFQEWVCTGFATFKVKNQTVCHPSSVYKPY